MDTGSKIEINKYQYTYRYLHGLGYRVNVMFKEDGSMKYEIESPEFESIDDAHLLEHQVLASMIETAVREREKRLNKQSLYQPKADENTQRGV